MPAIGGHERNPMPFYEHVYLARQDLAPAQVEGLTEAFTKVIADQGGAVQGSESWGLRNLAFRIAKNRKAHYVLLNIEAPPAAIRELERQVALNEDVIRFQTVRVEALESGPSAMMKKSDRAERGERGERGDRGDRGPRGDRDRGGERGRGREEGAW
jgi:small subunit ribosomal protein S6